METEVSNIIQAAGNSSELSFFTLFLNSDLIIKFVVLTLIVCSLYSWTIIIDKAMTISTVFQKSNRFEKIFWSGQLIEKLYEKVKHKVDHPMAAIFVAAMYEWNRQATSVTENNYIYYSQGVKERLYNSMEVAKNKAISSLEQKLSFLAIISSSAPFIGLFGTVWGIMISMKSIAVSKNASLAVVAPGISEALFATALGLIAAIPAVIAYNYLNSKIVELNSRFDDFQTELIALLSRELDKGLVK